MGFKSVELLALAVLLQATAKGNWSEELQKVELKEVIAKGLWTTARL